MARKDSLPPSVSSATVTIASSGTTSNAIDLVGMNLVGIQFPSAFTGSTVSFEASLDGSNYYAIADTAGTDLSVTVTADRLVALVAADLSCVRFLKIVSDSSEGAERTITLAIRVL